MEPKKTKQCSQCKEPATCKVTQEYERPVDNMHTARTLLSCDKCKSALSKLGRTADGGQVHRVTLTEI